MKKLIAVTAILSLLSTPVLAQSTTPVESTTAGTTNTASTATGTTGTAATGTATTSGFMGSSALAGLSTTTLVAIGVTVAAIGVAAANNDSSTSHAAVSHK